MKRLAFSTSLFILLIIAINVAIGGNVAYIYNSDQDAANSFDSLSG